MSVWIFKGGGLGNERIYKECDLGGGWVFGRGGGRGGQLFDGDGVGGRWGYMTGTVQEVDRRVYMWPGGGASCYEGVEAKLDYTETI